MRHDESIVNSPPARFSKTVNLILQGNRVGPFVEALCCVKKEKNMTERIRVQVDFGGERVWVATLPDSKISEVALGAAAQLEKLTGVTVGNISSMRLSLRGALLDPDEPAGFWLRDQELLFLAHPGTTSNNNNSNNNATSSGPSKVSSSLSSTKSSPPPSSAPSAPPSPQGLLIGHEAPPNPRLDLKAISSQVLILALLGHPGSGKTALAQRFFHKESSPLPAQAATKGHTWERKIEVEGVQHKLLVVDCPHGVKEDEILKGANGFIFLYDVCDRASFATLKDRLLGLFVAQRGSDPSVPATLVANKCDEFLSGKKKREVSQQEGIALAKELSTLVKGSVALIETSAADNTNVVAAVEETFLNVLQWRACDAKNEEGGGCVAF